MLSTEKARRLVREVEFPGDTDHSYRIAVAGKHERRALISGDDCRDRQTAGAVEMQRVWRGFRTRKKYTSIVERRRKVGTERVESGRFPLLKRRYGDYIKWCSAQLGVDETSTVVMEFSDYCARVIQIWWKRVKSGLHSNREIEVLTEDTAVKKIQAAWRGYKGKKTFSYYRKLINFRQRGDPAVLLKTINPSEARLLDKASGGCVRFRLGGSQFPPSIYYKIFTSQSVVDLCSYSPRDYTTMASRRELQRERHNHGEPTARDDDEASWYRRWENNGWRLVSERFFQSQLHQDSVTVETSAKRQPFHHSSLQRKAEVERRRRKNKIEWMKKLYQPPPDINPPSSAESEMVAAIAEDEEVDELVGWSQTLNYDDYVSDWSQIATSATLPASCDDRVKVM